jgi:hypothetical protein
MDGGNTLNIDGHNYVTTVICLSKQFQVPGREGSMTFDNDSVYLYPILEPLRLEDPSYIIQYTLFLPTSLCLHTVTTSNFAHRRSSSRDYPTRLLSDSRTLIQSMDLTRS